MSFEKKVETLSAENPKDIVENDIWLKSCKDRIVKLLPETQKAKTEFIDTAARLWKLEPELLLRQVREIFKKNYITEDIKRLLRVKNRLAEYDKSSVYCEKIKYLADEILVGSNPEIDPMDDDFIKILNDVVAMKIDLKTKNTRADHAVSEMTEFDIMNTIRLAFSENNEIEELFQKWQKPWGDANTLRYEALKKGISDERLDIKEIEHENSPIHPYDSPIKSEQLVLGLKKGHLRDKGDGTYTVQTSLSLFLGDLKTAKLFRKYTMFNNVLFRENGKPYTIKTLKREIQRWKD